MTTLTESFSGGTAGNNLTTGTTSFQSFGTTVPKFVAVTIRSGNCTEFATAGTNNAKWTGLSFAAVYLRGYFQFKVMPTSQRATIWNLYKTGSVLQASLEITTAGFLKIRNAAGTNLGTGTHGLVNNTLYRFEMDATTTTVTARLYDAADNLIETISGSATSTTFTEIWTGLVQATDGDYYADELTAQNTALTPIGGGGGGAITIVSESFEGGTAGTNITTSNTSFNAIGATAPKFNATLVKSGQSVEFLTSGTNTAKWTGLDWPKTYLRGYIYIKTMPTTARATLWSTYKTGTVLQTSLELMTTGVLRMRYGTGGTNAGTGVKALAINTLYRVEYDVDTVTPSQTFRIYKADGNTLETVNGTGITGDTTEVWAGLIQATDGDYLADELLGQSTVLTPITANKITVWWVGSTPLIPHVI